MGEGLTFGTLATLLGKRGRVKYGDRPVIIGAVGWKDGERWAMATDRHGAVILGSPQDFTIVEARRRKKR